MGYTKREFKFMILEVLDDGDKHNKNTIIGKDYAPGDLERTRDVSFSKDERFIADQAFEELRRSGLLRPTYTDLVDAANWVEITEAGRSAQERHALDDLDEALISIDPHLVDIRDGAWLAAESGQEDSHRQAAHSGKELIDQTLKLGAPDEDVQKTDWFTASTNRNQNVERRHRLKFLMERFKRDQSKDELRVAQKACELVLAVDKRLQSYAHSRSTPAKEDVRDAITAAEIALRRVLVNGAT